MGAEQWQTKRGRRPEKSNKQQNKHTERERESEKKEVPTNSGKNLVRPSNIINFYNLQSPCSGLTMEHWVVVNYFTNERPNSQCALSFSLICRNINFEGNEAFLVGFPSLERVLPCIQFLCPVLATYDFNFIF